VVRLSLGLLKFPRIPPVPSAIDDELYRCLSVLRDQLMSEQLNPSAVEDSTSFSSPLSASVTGGKVAVTLGTVPVAKGGTGAVTAGSARVNLGLEIGVDVQAWDASLDEISGLSPSVDDLMIYGASGWDLTPKSSLVGSGTQGTLPVWGASGLSDSKAMEHTGDNVSWGDQCFDSLSGGVHGVALGDQAARYATSANNVVAIGREAHRGDTGGAGGDHNVAIGAYSQQTVRSGNSNTTIGYQAGRYIRDGVGNLFAGFLAGRGSNLDGDDNIGLGNRALYSLSSASGVVGIGHHAGYGHTTGDYVGYLHSCDRTTANEDEAAIYLDFDELADGESLIRLNGYAQMKELANAPTNPAASSQVNVYVKDDKFVISYDDAGTMKYRYLDLTSTDATWAYTTTAI